MTCPSCGVELPADARFCIECGAELPVAASTGATTALPRYADAPGAVACRACGAASPAGADYCVRCGRRLADPAPARVQPAPAPLAAPAPLPAPVAAARPVRRRGGGRAAGAVFLIGLGLLMLLKLPFWPLILIVAGLSSFVHAAGRGRAGVGLGGALWLFALAFFFSMPRLLVPGIIALVGLSILLQIGRRVFRP